MRLTLLALPLVLVALTGCADKHAAYTKADTEGLYLAADGLKYQIQLSRELNPTLTEDRDVLRGLPATEATLKPGEEWFGVWLRVENDGKGTHTSADNFEITDAQGNTYEPLTVDTSRNVLAYSPRTLGPSQLYPDPDSVSGECCAREGAVLLFKLNRSIYQNRPAEFEIQSTDVPLRTQASVTLDL